MRCGGRRRCYRRCRSGRWWNLAGHGFEPLVLHIVTASPDAALTLLSDLQFQEGQALLRTVELRSGQFAGNQATSGEVPIGERRLSDDADIVESCKQGIRQCRVLLVFRCDEDIVAALQLAQESLAKAVLVGCCQEFVHPRVSGSYVPTIHGDELHRLDGHVQQRGVTTVLDTNFSEHSVRVRRLERNAHGVRPLSIGSDTCVHAKERVLDERVTGAPVLLGKEVGWVDG